MPSKTHVQEFDAKRVRPLPDQPRKRFRGIRELADSITEIGQATPGIVTLVEDDPSFDAQLVDGERRLRACQLAGFEFRAEVRPTTGIEETFVASFAANFGKQDHDCIEIAEGLQRMKAAGKTAEQLARIAGKSVPWVYNHLNLLRLNPAVRELMIADEDRESAPLTFSLAQLLVQIHEDRQLPLAKKITQGDGMSVAAARRLILKSQAARGDDSAYAFARGARAGIRALQSVLSTSNDRLGVYVDMPGVQFGEAVDLLLAKEKRQLIEDLEELSESLSGLADAVKRRLPAVGRRSA